MAHLLEIQDALNAPGFVTSSPLSFNQLKCQLAQKLCISVDSPIFEEHKEQITASYAEKFVEICSARTRASRSKTKARKQSKTEECDHSLLAIESEEKVKSECVEMAASVLPKRGRASNVAEVASSLEHPSKFSRLTVAELKTMLTDAGVACCFKKKCDYVAAVERLEKKENDGERGRIEIPSSDDGASAPAALAFAKPPIVVISSSDDEEAPVLIASTRTGGAAIGSRGATASVAHRRPISQIIPSQPSPIVAARGSLLFDPILDSNGAEIEVDENYRDCHDVLYGRLSIKTVGIQHYRGVIHVQEAVYLLREPRNPYDSNAIRVDNLSRAQIGHIAAKDGTASALAPLMDCTSPYRPRFEATLARQLAYACETNLEIFGLKEHFSVVQNYLASRRLFMSGGMCSTSAKDSTVEVKIKVANQVKSELDEMFTKMETEQTSEEAQRMFLDFVASGLMTTKLMEFQATAIAWMIHREITKQRSPFYEERVEKGQRVFFCSVSNSSSPSAPEPVCGGILADDMGLGKTLSTLALVAAMKCVRPAHKGTLVICPLSVISNWTDQVKMHFQHGALSCLVHHGSARDSGALDNFDVVITSYQTVASDFDALKGKKRTSLFSFEWERVVLDEAHNIRNSMTKMFKAVLEIKSKNRWCLTGTPLQNRAEDIHSLFQFLRLAPFDDKKVFMRYIGRPVQNGDPVGTSFLRTSLRSVCLRRTKQLLGLKIPKKEEFMCQVSLNDDAREVYDTLFKSTAEIFKQFLASEAASMSSIYQHVLEWLLRLRQCCLDPSLVPEARVNAAQKALSLAQENRGVKLTASKAKEMLVKLTGILSGNGDDEGMKVCAICYESIEKNATILRVCGHVFCDSCLHTWLETDNNSCPMCRVAFDRDDLLKSSTLEALSSADDSAAPVLLSTKVLKTPAKICALIQELEQMRASDPAQKAIVFSSFTKFLHIIEAHLAKAGFVTCRFVGSMSQQHRADVMQEFNKDGGPNVMVISLKAGNAGINLVRANHVYLMDPWCAECASCLKHAREVCFRWNTSVEQQAADRVHRMGQVWHAVISPNCVLKSLSQTRDVRVCKFVIENSIEQRILEIQQRKNALAGTITSAPQPHETAASRMQDLQALLSE